jgi:hypothetical protein
MKKLLSVLTILILGMYFSSCQNDSASTNSLTMKAPPPPPPNANPAWTYRNDVLVKSHGVGIPYGTVAVSDDGGANSANVYTAATDANNGVSPSNMTWSANGGSVSFTETPVGTSTALPLIKAVDVLVVGGVATVSNARTIYTGTTTDKILGQAWCPASTNAKIAFITKNNTSGVYSISTVSTAGGAATSIYSAPAGDLVGSRITWNSAGTELAILYKTGTALSIKVIDAATGAEIANLVAGTYVNISHIVWSNTGLDKIAFDATLTTTGSVADYNLYTIAPTNGSTETLVTAGFNPFWSPDNSTLVFEDGLSNTKKVVVSTGVVTTVGANIPYGDWK